MKAQRTDFWSVRDLARLLIEPDIGERFSPATESGRGVLVLDLAAGSELPVESDRAAILDILPTLPCVTVAIAGHRMPEPLEAMARACDVLLHDGGEVGPFLPHGAKGRPHLLRRLHHELARRQQPLDDPGKARAVHAVATLQHPPELAQHHVIHIARLVLRQGPLEQPRGRP